MATNTSTTPANDTSGDLSPLAMALMLAAGTVPGLIARYASNDNDSTPPELRQLLQLQSQRTAYQNPLFEAVTNQAFQGLPTYATQGKGLSGGLPTTPPTIAPSAPTSSNPLSNPLLSGLLSVGLDESYWKA
jgi:hypothetical protein